MLESAAVSTEQTGDQTAPQRAMDGFLTDFARQNPDLAWFAQLVAMQRQAAVQVQSDPPELQAARVEVTALVEQLHYAETRAEKLQRHARRLAEELDAAQERLSDLAAVLGACGLCWGEDRACRSCRGRGKPGMFAPEPATRSRFFAEAAEPSEKPNPCITPTDNSERN
ncbi:MAG: hypothetical protein QOH32_449 [Bradyrhizobium sp.]|jgi:hypothetical protein|nr:hypothetical protein [Bradyrhizobium sp.]